MSNVESSRIACHIYAEQLYRLITCHIYGEQLYRFGHQSKELAY